MTMEAMVQGLRRALRPLALAATALLAACGGGSSQVETFQPAQIVSFGDELSAFTADGSKYSINQLDDTGALECDQLPIWIQSLAGHYGMVYEQCNPDNLSEAKAVTFAGPGAMVDDVIEQVNSYTASGGTFNDTLVTVLVGTNDVLEQYPLYETEGEAALTAELRARGARLAQTINSIVDAGGKVIVATTPDVGLTPFAYQERASHGDIDRGALLSRLTDALNRTMRVNILNDGRYIGLVLVDDFLRGAARFPSTYGLADVTNAACAVDPPACTTETLVEGASSTSNLWADSARMGPIAHGRVGTLAVDRVESNPF